MRKPLSLAQFPGGCELNRAHKCFHDRLPPVKTPLPPLDGASYEAWHTKFTSVLWNRKLVFSAFNVTVLGVLEYI